jgi:hypothetical protein
MVGQSYAIRSLPSAICMRIIPSEGPVNILNFAANAHWYAILHAAPQPISTHIDQYVI